MACGSSKVKVKRRVMQSTVDFFPPCEMRIKIYSLSFTDTTRNSISLEQSSSLIYPPNFSQIDSVVPEMQMRSQKETSATCFSDISQSSNSLSGISSSYSLLYLCPIPLQPPILASINNAHTSILVLRQNIGSRELLNIWGINLEQD